MTQPIQEITDIAQQLKATYNDLNGRFIEHEENHRELTRLDGAELAAMELIKSNRTAIKAAYKSLTGVDIEVEK